MGETNHKQVVAYYPAVRESIEVDADMKDLLILLWSRGIKTNYSCQGSPFFVDQTVWEARQFRSYIQMERTTEAMTLVVDLLENFYAFKADKVSWEISFCRHPNTDVNRITLRFPHKDIIALRTYLIESMKEG